MSFNKHQKDQAHRVFNGAMRPSIRGWFYITVVLDDLSCVLSVKKYAP